MTSLEKVSLSVRAGAELFEELRNIPSRETLFEGNRALTTLVFIKTNKTLQVIRKKCVRAMTALAACPPTRRQDLHEARSDEQSIVTRRRDLLGRGWVFLISLLQTSLDRLRYNRLLCIGYGATLH